MENTPLQTDEISEEEIARRELIHLVEVTEPAQIYLKMDEAMKRHAIAVLKTNNWNKTNAALDMGVCIRTLRNWMRRWGLTHFVPICEGRPTRELMGIDEPILQYLSKFKCDYCESEFPVREKYYRKHLKDGKTLRFCCIEHRQNWQYEHKSDVVVVNCSWCKRVTNKQRTYYNYRLASGQTKFYCDNRCAFADKRGDVYVESKLLFHGKR